MNNLSLHHQQITECMKVDGRPMQSISYDEKGDKVLVIEQRKLPFVFEQIELKTAADAYHAIKDMMVRGAPLIGVTAAYAFYLDIRTNPHLFDTEKIEELAIYLKSARPTAVNLERMVDVLAQKLKNQSAGSGLIELSLKLARETEQEEIENCSRIGDFGLSLIQEISEKKNGEPVHILTHCNAGWLACVDWGTATAPIYKAHQAAIPVHVWVDETRPRNQGARLTAWELEKAGVPYTVIADNTGGHLMQHRLVDLALVGSDRTTRNGDVANKIGTYLKALAAFDNDIPFYVALPSSSIDFSMTGGINNIPIEQRGSEEILTMECLVEGTVKTGWLMPEQTPVANYGFDVTPARLVTGLITERGICPASENGLSLLFPDQF